MSKIFLFADEAGCFAFKRDRASKYYIICTMTTASCDLGDDLQKLRRQLAWDGMPVRDFFHCTEDKHIVRNAVFEVLARHDFEVHATIYEKAKAQPQVRSSEERFYKYVWLYHMRHWAKQNLQPESELHVTAATIGTRQKRIAFEDAVKDVCRQTIKHRQWRHSFWPSNTDPCLQAADYCTWAIQRKWERGDSKAFDLLADRIKSQYDIWRIGKVEYY